MFSSPILEVIIGLIFIYLLFSLLSTIINELIASVVRLRANNLHQAIQRMLDDDKADGDENSDKEDVTGLSAEFYKHPLVKYLSIKSSKKPSYIEPSTFARVVSDIIQTKKQVKLLSSRVEGKLTDQLKELGIQGDTAELLKSFAKDADEDWRIFEKKLEGWFNETMDRAKGWYNRKLKVITFLIGLFIAVAFNVDTLYIYNMLQKDASVREELVQAASDYVNTAKEDSARDDESVSEVAEKLGTFLNEQIEPTSQILGIGWSDGNLCPCQCEVSSIQCKLLKLLGWLITALAISLGAPFWFDLLNKLIKLRGAGGNPENKAQSKKPQPVG